MIVLFPYSVTRGLAAALVIAICCATPAAAQNAALTTVATFNGANGNFPNTGLTADASGNLYGTTYFGGANGYGTVFEIAAGSGTITTLASYNGVHPNGGQIAYAAGNIFGTTSQGGTSNAGTVFEIAAGSGTITTLASFNGANGNYPQAGLVADASGNLYGTTYQGGANGVGTVFEIAAGTSTITTLASFNSTNGAYPDSALIVDASGNLYGTTYAATNAHGDGTLFKIAAGSHTITTLATLSAPYGQYPGNYSFSAGASVLSTDTAGNIYDTRFWTVNSPTDMFPANRAYGAVFEIAAGTNNIATLATFKGTGDMVPQTGVVADAAGNVYGTTGRPSSGWSPNGNGTVFEIAAGTKAVTTLTSFNGANGAVPGGLIADGHGNLYGTTEYGGASSNGNVFELFLPTSAALTTGSNKSATTGGGLQNVGGTHVTLPAVTTAGTFSSLFSESKTPSDLQTAIGATAAGQIHFILPGNTAQLWQLSFSGAFTGLATVTLHFDPALVGNIPLSQLVVEHYENGAWVIPANQVIDPVADTITFTTDGFSPFILAQVPEPSSIVLAASMLVAVVVRLRPCRRQQSLPVQSVPTSFS